MAKNDAKPDAKADAATTDAPEADAPEVVEGDAPEGESTEVESTEVEKSELQLEAEEDIESQVEEFARRDGESSAEWLERVNAAAAEIAKVAQETADAEMKEAQERLGETVIEPAVKKIIAEIEKQTGLNVRNVTMRYTNTPKDGVEFKVSGLVLRKGRPAYDKAGSA